jgi:hypothetical protein
VFASPSGNEKLQPLGTLGLAGLAFCASATPDNSNATIKVTAHDIFRFTARSPSACALMQLSSLRNENRAILYKAMLSETVDPQSSVQINFLLLPRT